MLAALRALLQGACDWARAASSLFCCRFGFEIGAAVDSLLSIAGLVKLTESARQPARAVVPAPQTRASGTGACYLTVYCAKNCPKSKACVTNSKVVTSSCRVYSLALCLSER